MFVVSKLVDNCLLPAIRSTAALANFSPVRFRYYEDQKKNIFPRRFGYDDKLDLRGPLPRDPDAKRGMPVKEYIPSNPWTEKKALFGQNDYIDILGDENVHPMNVAYNVPSWLKGFKGTEFQMLLRKRNFFGHRMKASNPELYKKLRLRLKFLYHYNNHGYIKTRMHPKKDKLTFERGN